MDYILSEKAKWFIQVLLEKMHSDLAAEGHFTLVWPLRIKKPRITALIKFDSSVAIAKRTIENKGIWNKHID